MANLQNIAGFQTALGHGAHANKFNVSITAPTALSGIEFTEGDLYLAKSAAYPDKTLGVVEVHKAGRKLNLPGDTSFPGTYTITFYMTEEHNLRAKFLEWMNVLDNFRDNTHAVAPSTLLSTLSIFQIKSDGTIATSDEKASYTLYNVFPSNISNVSVDDATNNTILTFDVTFTYTYWE